MEGQKTVADLIKEKMQVDLPVDQVWELTKKLANDQPDLYIDLNAIDDAIAGLIATELDKTYGGLTVGGNSGQLAVAEESDGKKKNKKNTPATTNDSAQTLKPAVIGLRNAIESEVSGLSKAFDEEFTKNEKKAAQKITERAKRFAPNVVNYVAEELEGYKADSEVFHGQITGIIQEAFGGFLDN
jgi:hypothetical protein